MWSVGKTAYPISSVESSRLLPYWEEHCRRKDLGYLQLLNRKDLWESSQQRSTEIRGRCSRMIVLGMGGSSLGARAFLQATQGPEGQPREVLFFDNVDALTFHRSVRRYAETQQVHWVIVSKSGNTLETLAMANHLYQYFSSSNSFQDNLTIITEFQDNPLKRFAENQDIPCLEIPVDVGGRYSVFTPAGLLPIAFAGKDLELVQRGMNRASENIQSFSLVLAQQFLRSFEDEKWIHAIWPYADDLIDFGLWFQQLWAESLGKSQRKNGASAPRVSTPISLRGASDQHSVLQQIMEGHRDKLITFLRVQRSEDFGPALKKDVFGIQGDLVNKKLGAVLAAEAQATEETLVSAGVPCLRLETDDLDEESVSFLMQSFMMTVGVLGEVLSINAFDQPGVEAGKVKAKELLSSQSPN